MKVAIIFGSKSDISKMKGAAEILGEFNVQYNAYILSAHRVPEELSKVIRKIEKDGYECIIAGAGLAAHLPGVIAAQTILPVIGVPIESALDGIDALLSMVQMPKPIPVATVGMNNSFNAGMLAIEILSLKYPELRENLKKYRENMKEKFIKENSQGVEL
ncbi:5-(carboxyamino)imidazole ribonucleotide mutase [Clostridium botulinum]|uniref:N5-carboxyaminoimidazole ribonucleotide mutase n=1 Tax=Clostridium botulinum C/D str. DC5 TaxID=1443128 RepID=A0A0A0IHK6_CLOBO|nr:5-(carboxyamino)imidazole ribonucleotide mutase [Clostridium botulinum]KEI04036.1 N5-carboxyaminoimidazole ribonucleotide mutase [Clostridium botulinum C/D str. BKT75002]KEI10125.1 N5-carboxyaminoimidazole ribonucleotide mutase [Clostridium botulinum C/D str. BKT2873]KGM98343.1 N5-carboxyaminoimidazole ribonucleotide mutase [Clostridium botulinum D str. CCUG 7971]KGN00074.1 N5-carboxyaminoimidazole ribonucleotide mutase [Clostridium botulinum C/D str. DC5]KOC50905.1 N5-carboxyaminoimidazole